MIRDLTRYVDPSGHISVKVEIGRSDLDKPTVLESNAHPVLVAAFLRHIADDVMSADLVRQARVWDLLEGVRIRAEEAMSDDAYDSATTLAANIIEILNEG